MCSQNLHSVPAIDQKGVAMNKPSRFLLALITAGLIASLASLAPAAANVSEAAGLQISVVQSTSGSGAGRTITWNVTITDSQNRDFITTGTPTANQILIPRSSSRACVSAPVAFSANSLNSGDCQSFFTRVLSHDPQRVSTSSGTITYDLTSNDSGGQTVASYDAAQASTRPFGAVVAYLKFHTDTACTVAEGRCWNLYGSTGAWTPTAVAGISVVAGQGGSSGGVVNSSPVKYSGPEFYNLDRKAVLAGSAVLLEGRKLNLISSAMIGGKTAQLSSATNDSMKLTVPPGLAPGLYNLDVVTVDHGRLVHLNAFRVVEALSETQMTIEGQGIFSGEEFKKLTAFARGQHQDMNSVTCIVNSNSVGKSYMQARSLCDRILATNLKISRKQIESRSTVKSGAVYARVIFSSNLG